MVGLVWLNNGIDCAVELFCTLTDKMAHWVLLAQTDIVSFPVPLPVIIAIFPLT